jgi:hypothetical protein
MAIAGIPRHEAALAVPQGGLAAVLSAKPNLPTSCIRHDDEFSAHIRSQVAAQEEIQLLARNYITLEHLHHFDLANARSPDDGCDPYPQNIRLVLRSAKALSVKTGLSPWEQ